MKLLFKTSILFLACFSLLTACDSQLQKRYQPSFSQQPTVAETEYIIGIHPLHNPHHLLKVFGPLADYLTKSIPKYRFKIEASRNYASYDKKLYSKRFHFALPNPYQTINAIDKGYKVFAKMADDENFRGIILVRKDSQIKQLDQLKGKIVSYPAPTALAATMMPQFYMQSHGLDVENELDNRYVGSQESSIMNVYLGQSHAASTWPPPWLALSKERPELAEELVVRWQTEPLINNSFMALPELPHELIIKVRQLLLSLNKNEEGKKILEGLELSRFEAAKNSDYDRVRDFISRFHKQVRPIL